MCNLKPVLLLNFKSIHVISIMEKYTMSTSEHPRLRASMPTDPVPLYKSNHRPGLNDAGQPPAAYTKK